MSFAEVTVEKKKRKRMAQDCSRPQHKDWSKMDSKANRLARGRTFLLLCGCQRLDGGNNLSS
ncbi:hypothetical protein CJ030_MR1G023602 [Morella rubra]|uniref:Uncharacterized protein n=1 Tax=Morella rubra TaxID=262757 RepID=A0A6A1WLS3_9ROSI|nr:hypothetical protein CJ030_MR1G023602 [Morella rubra]